jgi:BirA family transcriptional regulator, biotin operon repressor / biotin---[acetyl-CoA-carboxylase] ligase
VRWALETHETLPSTQGRLKTLAADGAPEGAAVQALTQTDGHGRHGRRWISAPGNLYLSFLLRPAVAPQYTGQIALLTALAVAGTLRGFLFNPDLLTLKWPNDVLIKGKKCSGILLETDLRNGKLEWLAIGVGINVRTTPPEATCLCDHPCEAPPLEKVRDVFLHRFSTFHERWMRHGFDAIRAEWLGLAHKPGDPVQVRIGENTKKGTFYDIDALGNMLLKTGHNEIRTITAGDVYI